MERLPKRADVTGYVRMALSPAVAFLLLSAVTRAGWTSTQVLYVRETVTLYFLGAYYDTLCWILLTVMIGLVAVSDLLRGSDESARFFSIALIALVFAFGFSVLFHLSTLSIVAGAVIYFTDLLVPKRSDAFVKILGFFAPLTCVFVLDIMAELVYPASFHLQRSLPWLLSSSTQVATAAYHALDPVVPLLYAFLLLLPFALLLLSPSSVHLRIFDSLTRRFELGAFTVLGLALVLCGFASALLFVPFVVAGRPVGVDFGWYIDGVSTLTRVGIVPALASFSHPLALLGAAIITEFFQVSPEMAVQIFTVVVAVFAAAAAAWVGLQTTNSRVVALLSLLFSLFSIRATVGYSAGILANWLALGESLVAFGLLVRFLRFNRSRDLLMAIVVNVAVFATHVGTWMMLSLVTLLLLGLRQKRALLGIGVIVTVLALVSTGLPEPQVLSQAISTLAFRNSGAFLSHLGTLSQFFIFGLFTDPVILILSILGMIYASFVLLSHDWKYMILAWSALAGALVLFLSPESAWRALYQVPYEILAAFGAYLVWLACMGSGPPTKLRSSLAAILLLAICLATIANGVRAVLVLL